LADVAAGRVKDFDTDRIIARGSKLSADRSPSPDRHDRVYDSIEQTRALLNDLGRARPEIQPEARSIVIERWLALYCIAEDGAQVMRIMDGARDLSAIE
jgi:toxin ParE1/3/4